MVYLLFTNITFLGGGYGYANCLGPIDAVVVVLGMGVAFYFKRRRPQPSSRPAASSTTASNPGFAKSRGDPRDFAYVRQCRLGVRCCLGVRSAQARQGLGEDGLAVGVAAALLHVGQVRLVRLDPRRARAGSARSDRPGSRTAGTPRCPESRRRSRSWAASRAGSRTRKTPRRGARIRRARPLPSAPRLPCCRGWRCHYSQITPCRQESITAVVLNDGCGKTCGANWIRLVVHQPAEGDDARRTTGPRRRS